LALSLRLLPLVLANALSSPACAAACAPEQAMAEKCSCIFGIPAIHGGQMACDGESAQDVLTEPAGA